MWDVDAPLIVNSLEDDDDDNEEEENHIPLSAALHVDLSTHVRRLAPHIRFDWPLSWTEISPPCKV